MQGSPMQGSPPIFLTAYLMPAHPGNLLAQAPPAVYCKGPPPWRYTYEEQRIANVGGSLRGASREPCMRHAIAPLKTTLIGGVLFLIPFIIIVAVLGKAVEVAYQALKPAARWVIAFNDPTALALAGLAAVLLVLLLCFAAGMIARWAFARRFTQWIENRLNDIYPRYAVLKSMAQGYGMQGAGQALLPVTVQYEGHMRIAFEVERGTDGLVTVFLPGSPDPWAGVIAHVPAGRVTPLGADFDTVMKRLQWLGRGTASLIDAAHANQTRA